eukprot:scaffold13347_cov188-Alexandrium_tamarense.AAC.4
MNSPSREQPSNIMSTSSAHMTGRSEARIIGSAIAGISELALFHPVDTVAKRLMVRRVVYHIFYSFLLSYNSYSHLIPTNIFTNSQSTETQVVVLNSPAQTATNLNNAIFRNAAAEGISSKAMSLFPGIGFGAAYKILQRVYKFGGQPVVLDALTKKYGADFDERFGHKTGRTLLSATSGSLIGIGEVVLLPLDALKVKAQTAPEQLHGRGVVNIFTTEGFGLYRGAGLTVMRNAPGSFALFGGNTAAKIFMGVGEDGARATWTQDAIASCVGAIASISVAQPLDVIKTRIQNRPFDSPESGVTIFKRLIQNEGVGGLFKGLTPKLLVVGPKLIFSFTVAQHLIGYFEQLWLQSSKVMNNDSGDSTVPRGTDFRFLFLSLIFHPSHPLLLLPNTVTHLCGAHRVYRGDCCIDKSSRDVSTTATVDAKIVFAHAFTTTRKDLPLSLLSHQLRCGDVDFTNRHISYQSSTRLMANSSSLDEGTSSTKYHLVWSPRFWKKTILGFALWFLLQSVLLKTSISLAVMQPCHTDYTSFARALPSTTRATLRLAIPSMGCVACVNKIDTSIRNCKYYVSSNINQERSWLTDDSQKGGMAELSIWASSSDDVQKIAEEVVSAVTNAGFECKVDSLQMDTV